jgi:hypothetical protein
MDKSFNDLLVKLPRNLLRLLCKVLMKLDPAAPVEGLNDTQPAWEAVMTHLMAFGSADALVEAPVRVSVQAALRALCEYRPQLSEWVKENLSVTDITDIAAVDDDDSSEERRNAKGKRRAVSAVGRPRKNFPMKPYEPKRRKTDAEPPQPERKDGDHRNHDDNDDDDLTTTMTMTMDDEEPLQLERLVDRGPAYEAHEARTGASSSAKWCARSKEERYRLAAEPRERAAPKRPRKPILPIGREAELILQQQQLIQQQQQRETATSAKASASCRPTRIPPPPGANDPNPLLVNLQLEKLAFFPPFFFVFLPVSLLLFVFF